MEQLCELFATALLSRLLLYSGPVKYVGQASKKHKLHMDVAIEHFMKYLKNQCWQTSEPPMFDKTLAADLHAKLWRPSLHEFFWPILPTLLQHLKFGP